VTNVIGQTLLDQFRVDAFVASGGMGTVYKVWDLRRNVSLAMKVLHAELADDPSVFKRFEREARALQKLAHPNIVPFYGLFKTDEFAFLLEQYVDGPTLKQVLKRQGGSPLPIEQAMSYLKAMSAALGYAHANGVVHCDVKPGNVMIDRGGIIYLTDFGIARHAESTTTTLGFAGTAAYMAPEQIRGEAVTAATDVYALGVMFYEMLTGVRPFRGDEPDTSSSGSTAAERIRSAHLHMAPPDPQQVNPALPAGITAAVQRAMAKEPSARYRSTREFYEAVCAAVGWAADTVPDRVILPVGSFVDVGTQPIQPAPYETPQPALQPSPLTRQRKGIMLTAVIVAIAAVAIALLSAGGGGPASLPALQATTLTSTATKSPTSNPTRTATPRPTATQTPRPTPTIPPSPTIPSLPDLVVVGLRTDPVNPVQGRSYREIYVVSNSGTAPSPQVKVRIAWNDGGAGEFDVPPLGPGQSTEISLPVSAKESVPRTWRGSAQIDVYGVVQESDESNNSQVVEYTVARDAASLGGSSAPFVPGPLSANYSENSKSCKNANQYVITFSVWGNGGKPPYTYYRDIDKIGGPTRGGITYRLTYGEGIGAVGTFFVVDSTGQRAEIKFFVRPIRC
jgi:serine/threonine-protein kinase